jgi:hypothetical protein
MLADQFLEAVSGARTASGLDELARKLWRAHDEGLIADAAAEPLSEAIEARKAVLAGKSVSGTQIGQKPASGPPRACASRRRESDGDLMGDGVNIARRKYRGQAPGTSLCQNGVAGNVRFSPSAKGYSLIAHRLQGISKRRGAFERSLITISAVGGGPIRTPRSR